MDNNDHAELAWLLYNTSVRVQLGGEKMFSLSEDGLYTYNYVIYIPEVQQYYTGCEDLDDYDGVHWMDFDDYTGVGRTLKEAFDDFMHSNKKWIDLISSWLPENGTKQFVDRLRKEDEAKDGLRNTTPEDHLQNAPRTEG
jgi:hypothetical protein